MEFMKRREKNQNLDVNDVAEETRGLDVSLTMLFSSKFCGNMSWCWATPGEGHKWH